jgi:hypothetical protein
MTLKSYNDHARMQLARLQGMPEPREDDENSTAEIHTDNSDGEEGQTPDKQNKLDPPTQGMNLGFSKLFDEPI